MLNKPGHAHTVREAATILGLPPTVTQAALLPVAYYTGKDFRPARRLDADRHVHLDRW